MGNNGLLTFKHIIIDEKGPQDPHIKAVGDITGNGCMDTVVASSKGGPLVWYEFPDWKKHVIAPEGKWSCNAKVVDMTGNHANDILISDWYANNRLEWYENPGPSGNPAKDPWQHHIIGVPRAHDIKVCDLDKDGKMEIITRTQGDDGNKIVIWQQHKPNAWSSRLVDCPAGEGLEVADIDNDGQLEIIIGGRYYKADGNGWKAQVFADWYADAIVRVADMNRNGRPDVVLARSEGEGKLSWFESPADPVSSRWTEHVIDESVDFAHSLAVCDMNNDGQPDIVTAEMHQSSRKRVMVYLNQGDSRNWTQQVLSTQGSHSCCVADTDNNGLPDIIGANWSGPCQAVEMWQNLG
jgi:hypothetical protein